MVSRPTPARAILDAGFTARTSALLRFADYGHVVEQPGVRPDALSEDHGHVDVSQCAKRLGVGEAVSIIPNHTCVVSISNLFDTLLLTRGGTAQGDWTVAARGRTREHCLAA